MALLSGFSKHCRWDTVQILTNSHREQSHPTLESQTRRTTVHTILMTAQLKQKLLS